MSLLFVYGSLKEGFPNFHVNGGQRVPGEFITAQPHPLHLAHGWLPCLLPLPGQGLPVRGQLFEVDAAQLERMDVLERVGEPGGYQRVTIEVQDSEGGADSRVLAHVYVQSPDLIASGGPHPGPLVEYTLDHAQHLRW